MNLLITICARGGSKGIPKKNIKPINGKPLIVYTIDHAKRYAEKTGADIELSTDDTEIRDIATEAGLRTEYERPSALASDSAGKLETIQDVVQYAEKNNNKRYDYVLDLDVTSPLRTMDDLSHALQRLEASESARNIFSVSHPAHNPYFDMVEENTEGFFDLVKQPADQMKARQEGPRVYELNASFYFYKRAFFDKTPLVLMKNSLVHVMDHMCFEIDSLLDMEILSYLLKEKKLDFEFN